MFEIAPIINSLKDGLIPEGTFSSSTLLLMKQKFAIFLEDILGLQGMNGPKNAQFEGMIDLLIAIRKDAKAKKDFATSDRIRLQLLELGIHIKDEKDGNMSWGRI
jgi:cysteinyl-tRNA synthetase